MNGEMMETVTDFIFSGSKITTDGNCSHEIKRCLLSGRKAIKKKSHGTSCPFCLYFQEAPREVYGPSAPCGKMNCPLSPCNSGSVFLMPLMCFDLLVFLLYKLYLIVNFLRSFLRKTNV